MSRSGRVRRIRHPGLARVSGSPPESCRLSDRGRLAVVLQAAALLAHLETADWHLEIGWDEIRIDPKGSIRGVLASPGRDTQSAAARLEALLLRLFGGEERVAGRGEAKRLAGQWLHSWRQGLGNRPADRLTITILDQAHFLWLPTFSIARQALAAELEGCQSSRIVVAGRGGFESWVLARGRTLSGVAEVLATKRAGSAWRTLQNRARNQTILEGSTASSRQTAARRRLLSKSGAARQWLELAGDRVARGDLSAAARACRHARLLAEGHDPGLSLSANLLSLEVDLRRGSSAKLEAWPVSSNAVFGPLDQKVRGLLAELEARRELLQGRPAAALERLQGLMDRAGGRDDERLPCRRGLAARALGWLGRAAEARELLDPLMSTGPPGLDPEERPAVWALAGDWPRARESAADDEPGRLWRLGLAGDQIPDELWQALDGLDSYRAARLVFDFEILMSGKVPVHWVDRAVGRLRDVGAEAFAERLDRRRKGSWEALERYLLAGPRNGRELGDLFQAAGYFDARLEWRQGSRRSVLVPGRGGAESLTAVGEYGQLALSATEVDPALKALFALAARDYRPRTGSARIPRRVSGLIGDSVALRRALDRLERLAATDLAVLIQGETGTGKELAARQVHRLSGRRSEKWVAINCAALSESLLLSDLFGHVRGAFTGADRDRSGVFESASGGTVLLDEIGDLPLTAQGKLLRVLQEGEVRRLGESLPRRVDVRVLAATHRNLEDMVERGTFRSDLYYRLKVGSVVLPPLRERGDDVLVLAEYFVHRWKGRLTQRARRRLLAYSWPGNVRELRNVLQLAVALSEEGLVDAPLLELPGRLGGRESSYHEQVDRLRRRLVREALTAAQGSRAQAARNLGVSRQALSYLVRRFGLET